MWLFCCKNVNFCYDMISLRSNLGSMFMRIFKMEQNMDYLTKLDEEQRIVFIKVLARLASADGNLDESEKDFICQVAKIYNISENRIADVLKFSSDDDIVKAASIITDRAISLELIKEMCILSHSDSDLSERETLLIGRVGQAMGIELEKIEQISQWVLARVIWEEEGLLIFEKNV